MVVCALVWATNVIVGKLLVDEMPPFTLAFCRNLVAVLAILPFAIREKPGWEAFRENRATILIAGSLGTGVFNALVYHALHTTTGINAVMVMSLVPAAVPVISFLVIRERLHFAHAIGIALSLVGVALIVTRGQLGGLLAQPLVIGDALMFCAMLCWSTYTVFARRRTSGIGPYSFFLALVVVATAILFPFALWEWSSEVRSAPVTAWLAVLYIGLFPTTIALVLFNGAVLVIGANLAGAFQHLVPVFGTLMSVWFLGEHFGAHHAAGAGLIAAGLFAATRAPRVGALVPPRKTTAPR